MSKMTVDVEYSTNPLGSPTVSQNWHVNESHHSGAHQIHKNISPQEQSNRRVSAFTPARKSHLSSTSTPTLNHYTPQLKQPKKNNKSQSSIKKTPNHSRFIFSPSRTITESLTLLVSSTAQQLEEIWDEVGYNPEERTSQLSDLLLQFRDLCESKVAEEQGVAETFRHTIMETKTEITTLSTALRTPVDSNLTDTNKNGRQNKTTLTDELAILEATLEGLRERATIAKSDLEKSQNFLIESHEMLGLNLEQKWNDIESDLTLERQEEFHRKVQEMKEEITTRSSAVIQLLRDCQHLMDDLRIDVHENGSSLDHQISGSLIRAKDGTYNMASNFRTATCTGISSTALEELTGRVAELNAEKRRRTVKLEEMGANIMVLWEKLRVSDEEQRAFSETIQGLGLDTIEKGEAELQRLHALKSEMLGKLILEARETIASLWNEIDATEDFRKTFQPYAIQEEAEFTDEFLEEHEEYIEKLRELYEEMKPILRVIERRDVILRERVEYQELQKDSDRLKQRGAALTKQLMEEEKMAKRIKRELPKLTTLLQDKLKEWKAKHGKEFQLHGEDYFDIMERQEQEWNLYKEKEMEVKLKKKQDEKGYSENQRSRMGGQLPKRKPSGRPLGDARNRDNMRSTSRSRAMDDRGRGAVKSGTQTSRSRSKSSARF